MEPKPLAVKGVFFYVGNKNPDPEERDWSVKVQAYRVREMLSQGKVIIEDIKTVEEFDAWLKKAINEEDFDIYLRNFNRTINGESE